MIYGLTGSNPPPEPDRSYRKLANPARKLPSDKPDPFGIWQRVENASGEVQCPTPSGAEPWNSAKLTHEKALRNSKGTVKQ